jgi:hypothetical protein
MAAKAMSETMTRPPIRLDPARSVSNASASMALAFRLLPLRDPGTPALTAAMAAL